MACHNSAVAELEARRPSSSLSKPATLPPQHAYESAMERLLEARAVADGGGSRSPLRRRGSGDRHALERGGPISFYWRGGARAVTPVQDKRATMAAANQRPIDAALDDPVEPPREDSLAVPPPYALMHPEGNRESNRRLTQALLRDEISAAQRLLLSEPTLLHMEQQHEFVASRAAVGLASPALAEAAAKVRCDVVDDKQLLDTIKKLALTLVEYRSRVQRRREGAVRSAGCNKRTPTAHVVFPSARTSSSDDGTSATAAQAFTFLTEMEDSPRASHTPSSPQPPPASRLVQPRCGISDGTGKSASLLPPGGAATPSSTSGATPPRPGVLPPVEFRSPLRCGPTSQTKDVALVDLGDETAREEDAAYGPSGASRAAARRISAVIQQCRVRARELQDKIKRCEAIRVAVVRKTVALQPTGT